MDCWRCLSWRIQMSRPRAKSRGKGADCAKCPCGHGQVRLAVLPRDEARNRALRQNARRLCDILSGAEPERRARLSGKGEQDRRTRGWKTRPALCIPSGIQLHPVCARHFQCARQTIVREPIFWPDRVESVLPPFSWKPAVSALRHIQASAWTFSCARYCIATPSELKMRSLFLTMILVPNRLPSQGRNLVHDGIFRLCSSAKRGE